MVPTKQRHQYFIVNSFGLPLKLSGIDSDKYKYITLEQQPHIPVRNLARKINSTESAALAEAKRMQAIVESVFRIIITTSLVPNFSIK